MTVLLTISDSLNGTQISDTLAGGGTGVDLGSCGTSSFAPLISKPLNQGAQDLYIRHDGVNEIQDVKFNIQQYGIGTSFTYGGADTAANDFATLKNLGFTSGSSKNNNDGLSGGLWIDMNWQSDDSTRFDQANFPTLVKIFGDNNTDGISLSSAFALKSQAMVYSSGGTETGASGPSDQIIGPSGNTVKGDNAHVKLRIYLPSSFASSGIVQCEIVTSYSYTS